MLQYPEGGEGCERRPTRYLYVSPVNLRGGLPTLSSTLRSILVSLVILFLPNFFFPLSFLSFFPSYRYTLISHLSLTSSLFSFYIFLATSSPLSLSRRFRWYPIIPFLQPLFFIPSVRRFFHTHIHTYIYTLVSFSILYIQVIPKLIAIRFVHSLKLDESFPPHFPLNPRPTPEQTAEGFRHLELPTSLLFLSSLSLSIALHRDGQTVIIGEGSDYSRIRKKESILPNVSRVNFTFFFFLNASFRWYDENGDSIRRIKELIFTKWFCKK